MKSNTTSIDNLAINGFIENHKFNEKELLASGIVALIRPFIRNNFQKIQSINKAHSSYGLKHLLEKHTAKNIANGELIYAMHLEGFQVYRPPFDINCHFNISEKSVTALK